MQTVSIFALVGASHCVLLLFLCLQQPLKPRNSDRLLAIMLGLEGIRLFAMVAYAEGSPESVWGYAQVARILLGPLFYFYTLSLIGKPFSFTSRSLLHLLPFLAWMIGVMVNRWSGFVLPREAMTYISGLLNGSVFIAYGVASWLELKQYRSDLKQQYSALEHINLRWLQYVAGYFCVLGSALILAVLYLSLNPQNYSFTGTLIFSTVTTMIFCYVISLKGMQQERVFEELLMRQQADSSRSAGDDTAIAREKYEGSSLSREEAGHYYQLVVGAVEQDKLYLRQRLRLGDLSEAVGLHPQQVSQVINQCADMHFCDFINTYRVQEAMLLLQGDAAHRPSILDIAEQAGFNSPATFYKYFRKHTGMSPRRYRQQQAA